MARATPRDLPRHAALLAAAVLAGLVLAEIAVRALGVAPEAAFIQRGRYRLSANPRIGYEPVPHLEHRGTGMEFWDWRGRSNSLGFRDAERTPDRPSGVVRVLVLGDSIAAGLKIDDDRSIFPAVLERLLGERGVAAEVLNFGVSGYNTQQEVETLKEKGLRFRPDVVVLAYCLNDSETRESDILRVLRAQAAGRDRPDLARLAPWLARSALVRFVRYRVLAPREEPGRFDDLVRDRVEEYLHELGRLARGTGFRAMVAVFPLFGDLARYPHGAYHDTLRGIAADAGLDYLDLLPAFRDCERRGPVALDPLHPSVLGHECAARALAEAILGAVTSRAGAGRGAPRRTAPAARRRTAGRSPPTRAATRTPRNSRKCRRR
jgi:lysophospholipase L1-like esterase